MIFVSAGHHRKDPGAVANGMKESEKAMEFRDLVVAEIKKQGRSVVTDNDDETLGQYLSRIKTGNGSVVLEFHFDAATPSATGTTALVGDDADSNDKYFAKELSDTTACVLGIKNRGVKFEKDSHRGKLALMRKEGIVCLLELCFLTNLDDMKAYEKGKKTLAKDIAYILVKYEDLIK